MSPPYTYSALPSTIAEQHAMPPGCGAVSFFVSAPNGIVSRGRVDEVGELPSAFVSGPPTLTFGATPLGGIGDHHPARFPLPMNSAAAPISRCSASRASCASSCCTACDVSTARSTVRSTLPASSRAWRSTRSSSLRNITLSPPVVPPAAIRPSRPVWRALLPCPLGSPRGRCAGRCPLRSRPLPPPSRATSGASSAQQGCC